MKLFQAYHLLIIFVLVKAISTRNPVYTKAGCQVMCGKLKIPYPFGIGANCSLSEWYSVDCNRSTPYLPALHNVEVLGVNLEYQTVTVNIAMISDRFRRSSQILGVELVGSPFLFSRLHNKFVVEGCGNAVILDHGTAVTGCSTTCRNDSVSDKDNCLGITCCETTLPYYLKSYSMDLTGLERHVHGGDGACGSAFLVDQKSYVEGRFSGQSDAGNNTYIPISLLWTLSESEFSQITCCYADLKLKVDMGNGTSITSSKCIFPKGVDGNPYLIDGCDVFSEREECASCAEDGGACAYHDLHDDYDRLSEYEFVCYHSGFGHYKPRLSMGAILGASISIGVLFLVAISYALYKVIKKTKARRCRRRFFKRNGGLLLKQQQESDPSLVGKTILFTSQELEKATGCFNENRILGVGGQGTVYKGMLADGRIVAVKKSKVVDESQLEQFINEVVILSQVNHRNVVKLLGCCLETEVPLLVSEFVSNGTLYDHIHSESNEFPISLKMRLRIATEVARAVAYLHSGTSIPIYHRDIKSTNILLDDKYMAKVSDFGTSRFVSSDQTHLTTSVKGTVGYLDPEYFQSSQFTDKSDVYSFGVVLVELLTGERPIARVRSGENRSLVAHFMSAMEEGRVISIFDAMIINEGTTDGLLVLADLAMRCLNMNGRNRPTMKEVELELEAIRTLHVPSMVQANIGQVMGSEESPLPTHAESSNIIHEFN